MKISSDANHPDYHDVVMFIDKITIDGCPFKNVLHVDTEKGVALCVTQPYKPTKDGNVATHTVFGKIGIVWRTLFESQNKLLGSGAKSLFEKLKADWEAREIRLKQESLHCER